MLLLVLCALLLCVSGQTYLRTTVFKMAGCTAGPALVRSVQTTCTPGAPTTCANGASGLGEQTQCVQGVPSVFENAITVSTYPSSACSGNPSEILSFVNGICVQYLGVSFTAGCSGGFMTLVYFTNTNVCLGPGYYTQSAGGVCSAIPPGFVPFNQTASTHVFAQCTAPCFHESTEITYDAKDKITLQSALAGEHSNDCHVPHVMQANGVHVETSCNAKPLRLTNDHLVYTASGLRRASSLIKGDVLYSDMEQHKECAVKNVKGEFNQKYFGLNCRKSDVLADGRDGLVAVIPSNVFLQASRPPHLAFVTRFRPLG